MKNILILNLLILFTFTSCGIEEDSESKTSNIEDILWVGHAGGANDHIIEGTMDNINLATEEGVTILELDILISSDSIPFIAHNWPFMEAQFGISEKLTWEELQALEFEDGQKIASLDEVMATQKNIIFDIGGIKNTYTEKIQIIEYLLNHFEERMKTDCYIQTSQIEFMRAVHNTDENFNISFNMIMDRPVTESDLTTNIMNNLNEAQMFTINPSEHINEILLTTLKEKTENKKTIIAVIPLDESHENIMDNMPEIERIVDLGIDHIMVYDIINVKEHFNLQ